MRSADLDPDAADGDPSAMSRRALLRRSGAVAAGGATAGGLGVTYAVDDARAVGPLGIFVAGAAAGVLVSTAAGMYYSGGGPDEEDILGAIQFEDHLQAYNRFREWWEVENEIQLASFRNDIDNFADQVLNTGIRRVYEGALEGDDQSTAISEAKSDMDSEADELAEWIVSWWNSRILSSAPSKLHDLGAGQISSTDDPARHQLIQIHGNDNVEAFGSYSLPGGSKTVDVAGIVGSDGAVCIATADDRLGIEGRTYDPDTAAPNTIWHQVWATEPDPSNYSFDADEYDGPEDFDSWEHVDGDQQGLDAGSYVSILQDLEDALETAKTDLDNVGSDHFQEMQDREIDLSELLTPTGLMETAGEADTAHEAALFFRAQEMPQGSEPVVVEFDVPDDLQGEVGQETITAEGYLGWSVAQGGDTLPVGEPINPGNYLGRIYFATQYVGENDDLTGDVVEMTGPFTIVSTDSGSTPLEFEEPTAMPDADTDPDETIRIFQDSRDSEEDARENTVEVVTSDDGGGWSWPSFGLGSVFGIPGWLYAVVGLVVAWRVSQDGN